MYMTMGDTILDMVDSYSKHVLLTRKNRTREELALAGFFAKRNVLSNFLLIPFQPCVPMGTVLHYAPKNVDTTFAYVLLMSIICGNDNLVRLTSDDDIRTRQLDIVNEIKRFTDFDMMTTNVIDESKDVVGNERLASCCDVRVIWGGDATIDEIRHARLRPAAKELAFYNRSSIAVIDVSRYVNARDTLNKSLSDDITWMGQQSCTSVKGIIWIGDQKDIDVEVSKFNVNKLMPGTNKRSCLAQLFAAREGKKVFLQDNVLNVKCDLDEFSNQLSSHCNVSGVVFHACTDDIAELLTLKQKLFQTIVYDLNDDDFMTLKHLALNHRLCNRFVKPGKSMEFNWIWDGYEIVSHLVSWMTW